MASYLCVYFCSRSEISLSVDGPNLDDTTQIYDLVMESEGNFTNLERTNDYDGLERIRLSDYQLNQDPEPLVINKKHSQGVVFNQDYAVRYLKPPTPPAPGEVIIHQEPNIRTKPAPPLVIRQIPARSVTPEPLIIREAPPPPPKAVPVRCIRISGKLYFNCVFDGPNILSY